MKYYIIAGEKSGDLHAANLMRALQEEDKEATFRYWGGEEMQKVSDNLVKSYQEISFMGFWEVFKNLPQLLKYIKYCKEDVLAYQPDVLILVDFAGFNMKIAKFAKAHNIKTFYYISPKIWAWNQSRAKKIKAVVDRMFVILPFEKDFYKKYNYDVDYIGNPLLDAIGNFKPNPTFLEENNLTQTKPIIAILPGSRKQELQKILPLMLEATQDWGNYQWIVAGISALDQTLYEGIKGYPHIKIIWDQTYDLLTHAQAALVTSGTATLETALFEVPQVVCYRTSGITYKIIKNLIRIKYIALVNLILDKEAVKELIQDELTVNNIHVALKEILPGGINHAAQLNDYKNLKKLMGDVGASQKAAKLMMKYLHTY